MNRFAARRDDSLKHPDRAEVHVHDALGGRVIRTADLRCKWGIALRAVGQLRRATDSVHEIALVIGENIDSQLLFGSSDIPADDWPQVREELHRLIRSATGADEQITRLLGDPDVIDVESWEVEYVELDSGDT